jgi:nucleoside-diphosphate-sugar epimerase
MNENQIIAITGSTGVIGSKLSSKTVSLKCRLEAPESEMINELKKIKPTVVIHLAGMSLADECEKNPLKCHELNVEGSKKWFQASLTANVQKFVFASTSHVYADSQKPIQTDDPLGPANLYGKSKMLAESELTKLAQNGSTQLMIARIFSLLDENSKPGFLYPNLIIRAKNKDYSPIPGLNSVRDFLTSSEIADKILKLANSSKAISVVNICSGKPTSIKDLASRIYSQFGADPSRIVEGAPSPRRCIIGIPTEF